MNYNEIKKRILEDGDIDAAEAAQLRELIFEDGTVSKDEKQLLRDLKAGATSTSPEFDQLCVECGV